MPITTDALLLVTSSDSTTDQAVLQGALEVLEVCRANEFDVYDHSAIPDDEDDILAWIPVRRRRET
jgi:hypothetical protein